LVTPYIPDRIELEAYLGVGVVAAAVDAGGADIARVIAGQCAVADGFVAAQVTLPPSPTAQAQVAPIVADLVYCVFYADSDSAQAARCHRGQASLNGPAPAPCRRIASNAFSDFISDQSISIRLPSMSLDSSQKMNELDDSNACWWPAYPFLRIGFKGCLLTKNSALFRSTEIFGISAV
jgi:hypothetical protein